MMASKFEDPDDSRLLTQSPPPSYDNISTLVSSADSTKGTNRQLVPPFRQFLSSVFSYRQRRKMVLSRIRDIVSAPDFIPSSIAPVIETCVTQAAFSPADFSNLLQTPIIEGHTAMYWAVMNHRWEAVSAFAAFIPRFSSVCFNDLRLACMIINDHASFAQLNLGRVINSKDESLRRLLNCPPDEVQVQTGDKLLENKFVACLRIRMFQKRLRMAQVLGIEFVAGGRIWVVYFCTTPSMIGWYISLRLSRHSSPARPEIVLVIKAHGGVKPGWCRATRSQDLRVTDDDSTEPILAPKRLARVPQAYLAFDCVFGDKLINETNTIYLDCDGTLHINLEMTLR